MQCNITHTHSSAMREEWECLPPYSQTNSCLRTMKCYRNQQTAANQPIAYGFPSARLLTNNVWAYSGPPTNTMKSLSPSYKNGETKEEAVQGTYMKYNYSARLCVYTEMNFKTWHAARNYSIYSREQCWKEWATKKKKGDNILYLFCQGP